MNAELPGWPGASGSPWLHTILHDFDGENGSSPTGLVNVNGNGTVLGILPYAGHPGTANNGAIFQLTF